MSMTVDESAARPNASDVKQSFAWGQLFAGSLIGGLAAWKLLHKMTNTEPSEWFAGLSVAYEEVRDFVMTPFDWIQLDLTQGAKNLIVVAVILIGALARARHSSFGFIFAMAISATVPLLFVSARPNGDSVEGALGVLVVFFTIGSVLAPIASLLGSYDGEFKREQSVPLLNTLFITLWGTALLLLNWATS